MMHSDYSGLDEFHAFIKVLQEGAPTYRPCTRNARLRPYIKWRRSSQPRHHQRRASRLSPSPGDVGLWDPGKERAAAPRGATSAMRLFVVVAATETDTTTRRPLPPTPDATYSSLVSALRRWDRGSATPRRWLSGASAGRGLGKGETRGVARGSFIDELLLVMVLCAKQTTSDDQ